MDPNLIVCSDARALADRNDTLCGVCKRVVVKPVTCLQEQDHLFCSNCVQTHASVTEAQRCPLSGHSLHPKELIPNRLVENMVSRFTIRCPNRERSAGTVGVRKRLRQPSGCRWQGLVSELPAHEKVCGHRRVMCPSCGEGGIPVLGMERHMRKCGDRMEPCGLCGQNIAVRALAAHIDVCPDARLFCPNACLLRPGEGNEVLLLPRKDVAAHLLHCPRALVSCLYSELGCSHTGYRENMRTHWATSMEKHMELMRNCMVELRKTCQCRHVGAPKIATKQESCPGTAVLPVGASCIDDKNESALRGPEAGIKRQRLDE